MLFLLQLVYAAALYSSNAAYVSAATALAPHFVAHNLLLFGFVHLWVRAHYVLAVVLLVVNFANLSAAYFRHSTAPRAIHVGVVSGPLAWNFVALYWAGAVAVHSNHLAARIVANVFIWGWLGYGVFFLAAYKDYTMGFAVAWLAFCKFPPPHFFAPSPCPGTFWDFLARAFDGLKALCAAEAESLLDSLWSYADWVAATGLGQLLTSPHVLQLQYIFAFTIAGLLFVLSLAVGVPGLLGRDPFPRGQIVSEDRERAPLLADE